MSTCYFKFDYAQRFRVWKAPRKTLSIVRNELKCFSVEESYAAQTFTVKIVSMITPLDMAQTVTGMLQFTILTGETPVTQVSKNGGGRGDPKTGQYEMKEVTIHNGRPIADKLDIDAEGFEFLKYNTAVTDFTDDDQVSNIYYPELEKLLLERTGAKEVLIFDHTIRIGDRAKREKLGVRDPVRSAHNDFTDRSAPQRVKDLLPAGEAEDKLSRRFTSINVWRPLTGPVKTDPIAICPWDSIGEKDMIPAERNYGNRIGGILNLSYNANQRWTYFPDMERDEVILLKCYDSELDGRARWTAHAAFEDPKGPDPSLPARESIEVRTLIFY